MKTGQRAKFETFKIEIFRKWFTVTCIEMKFLILQAWVASSKKSHTIIVRQTDDRFIRFRLFIAQMPKCIVYVQIFVQIYLKRSWKISLLFQFVRENWTVPIWRYLQAIFCFPFSYRPYLPQIDGNSTSVILLSQTIII